MKQFIGTTGLFNEWNWDSGYLYGRKEKSFEPYIIPCDKINSKFYKNM